MEKVLFGVAAYGSQPPEWWTKVITVASTLNRYDVQFMGVAVGKSMAADGNRNDVVESFLKSGAEWLMWIDTDNPPPLGAVRRLLDTGKTLVTGLYFLKKPPYHPVALIRDDQNLYHNLENYNRGELIPIDAAGIGCLLSHRSVYEDMRGQCVVAQRWDGGQFAIHRDDIVGSLPETINFMKPPKVVNGKLTMPVCKPKLTKSFPWFMLEYGRTEDMIFFELAARCGHGLWCDTSIEVSHQMMSEVTGADWRTWKEEHLTAKGETEVEMIYASA